MLYVVGGLVILIVGLAGAWWVMANNVETPDYAIVRQEGAIEVRDYPALVVAEVLRSGDRWSAINQGFSPLAGYIFARERDGEKIAMTAPVTQQRTADDAAPASSSVWRVHFIMPKDRRISDLPKPAGSDVSLRQIEPGRRAAIRFSGVATDELIARKESNLRNWLAAQGMRPTGQPIYAYYNDPFTPGFLRRNEVLIDVRGLGF